MIISDLLYNFFRFFFDLGARSGDDLLCLDPAAQKVLRLVQRPQADLVLCPRLQPRHLVRVVWWEYGVLAQRLPGLTCCMVAQVRNPKHGQPVFVVIYYNS